MHITGGSTSQRSPASSGFHGGTDDQPPALTSELPTDPQQRPGLQEPLPKCQLLELRDHLPGQGWPLPLLHRRLSSSEGLLFSRPGPRRPSSPAMPEPSLHPSARFPCLIFPTGAFSRVCQFPPPGGPLLRLPSPRQSLQGRGEGGCGARANGTPWGRREEAVASKLQWQRPSRQIFFFQSQSFKSEAARISRAFLFCLVFHKHLWEILALEKPTV